MSFTQVGDELIARAAKGLYKAGTVLMAESQELVPVETGTLKRSGVVQEPVIDGDSVSVTIGYGFGVEYETKALGDGDEEVGPGYGVYVHEILENRHLPPTQAKFLEAPAMSFGPQMAAILDEEMRR